MTTPASGQAYGPSLRRSYAEVLRALLDALAASTDPALAGLGTRATYDPAIALLDAWATLADVLGFYSRRIADEGYLRTATEDLSVTELARLVGYQPAPGLAASVYLAYEVDPVPDLDTDVIIAERSRAQSLPEPGQTAQPFETTAVLRARARWNTLAVQRTYWPAVTADTDQVYLAGLGTTIRPRDVVAVWAAGPEQWLARRVSAVEPDRPADRTLLRLAVPAAQDAALGATGAGSATVAGAAGSVTSAQVRGRTAALDALHEAIRSLGKAKQSPLGRQVRRGPAAPAPRVLPPAPPSVGDIADLLASMRPVVDRDLDPAWAAQLAGITAATAPAEGAPADGVSADGAPADAAPADRVPLAITTMSGTAAGSAPAYPAAPGDTPTTGVGDLPSDTDVVRFDPPTGLFGASAPGKVLVKSGSIVRVDDWPRHDLAALIRFGFDLEISPNANRTLTAVRVHGEEQISFQMLWTGSAWRRLPPQALGPMTVTALGPATVGEPFPLTLTFAEKDPTTGRSTTFGITIALSPDDGTAILTTAQGQVQSVALRHLAGARFVSGNRMVTVQADRNTDGNRTVSRLSLRTVTDQFVLTLDGTNPRIGAGSLIAVGLPGIDALTVCRVKRADTVTARDYGIVRPVTELTLADPWPSPPDTTLDPLRAVAVYLESGRAGLAEAPISEPVTGSTLVLDGLFRGLEPGRLLAVTGPISLAVAGAAPSAGPVAAEIVAVAALDPVAGSGTSEGQVRTTVTLATGLSNRYLRDQVTVLGNVAPATHGATNDVPLGSGDAGQALQSMALPQAPLTWLPTAQPTRPVGGLPDLDVTVDGISWQRASSWIELVPGGQQYLLATDATGQARIRFGDGYRGARLPTGVENVRARYRSGSGPAGNVAAERITQLQSRPLGVRAVRNPQPASGGTAPEAAEDVRRGAVPGLVSLGRVVALADYEDFALSWPGIGKAAASLRPGSGRNIVEVTVSGTDTAPLPADSALLATLASGLAAVSADPSQQVNVGPRRLHYLIVRARLRLLPGRHLETVVPAASAALLQAFGYHQRRLGQSLERTEILLVLQEVAGVDAVDLDEPGLIAETAAPAEAERALTEPAGADQVGATDLLVFDPTIPNTLSLVQL